MTCRPHHALCPARDGGECCCEPIPGNRDLECYFPLPYQQRVELRAWAERKTKGYQNITQGHHVLRLLHERDQLERERDNARRLADRLAYDLRRIAGDCAGCSPHDCATAALLQEYQVREMED